jgi:hypothetical protein
MADLCASGVLPSSGSVDLYFRSTRAESVVLSVSSPPPAGGSSHDTKTLTWKVGGFSPGASKLTFVETADSTPQLRTYTGQLTLRFQPTDACGIPVELPSTHTLSFAGDAPLYTGTPTAAQDGSFVAPVRMNGCPADPTQPVSVWAVLDGTPILQEGGARLQRQLFALCMAPDVWIDVHPKDGISRIAPGDAMEFEVQLRNDGTETFAGGRVGVELFGFTLVDLAEDGTPLTAYDDTYVLPELLPGQSVTLRGRLRANTDDSPSPSATVWFARSDGAVVSERKVMQLEREELGVDVGGGCAAAGASGRGLVLLLSLTSLVGRRPRRIAERGRAPSR